MRFVKGKKNIFLLIAWFILVQVGVIYILFAGGVSFGAIAINASLLSYFLSYYYIWPILGTLVCILVFPRIFSPLFLRIKPVFSRGFRNAYLDIDSTPFNLWKFMLRGFSIFLFCLGVGASLITLWLYNNAILDAVIGLIPILYSAEGGIVSSLGFFEVYFVILPIIVGILAVGWAFEDAGVIHYKLQNKVTTEFFEIQPIHLKYRDLILGYASLSSVFYFARAIYYYWITNPSLWYEPLLIFIFGFMITLLMIPAYIIYGLVGTRFLRKKLDEVQPIGEAQLKRGRVRAVAAD
jgi:hypothetical protein